MPKQYNRAGQEVVRVKIKTSGHVTTVLAEAVKLNPDAYIVQRDKPAVDREGIPLPDKHAVKKPVQSPTPDKEPQE